MNVADWIGTIAGTVTILTAFTIIVRYLIHGATDPIAAKVADHDVQIGKAIDLATSANIKGSRIEGYLAGMGRSKLPDVTPTVEKQVDGEIVEEPLLDQ